MTRQISEAFARKDPPSREEGFTLVELMVVIVILGILVGIAVPVYISSQDKASRTRAESNHRIGCSALNMVYQDIVARGGDAYVDPDTGEVVDAAYLGNKEHKIHWWDFDSTPWPGFDELTHEQIEGVAVVTGTDVGPGNADHEEIVVACVALDGTVWYTHYTRGIPDDSSTFNWDDGPPSGP